MPGFDGTGPRGSGPMTGGGRGYCAVPFAGWGFGVGPGRFWGRGGSRGWRHWYNATGLPGWCRAGMRMHAWGYYPFPGAEITPGDEAAFLREQVTAMEKEMKQMQERIAELDRIAAKNSE